MFEEDFEMVWKPAKDHFRGGTDAAMALKGKKVRAIKAMNFSTSYLGEGMGPGQAVHVKAGTVAVVGSVPPKHMDHLLVAVPRTPQSNPSLASLMLGSFDSLLVNWPTFRSNFEIDV
jgi:hypothetical protein